MYLILPILLFLSEVNIAYVDEASKHRMKLALYDIEPRVENCWVAPNATLSNPFFLYLFMSVGEVLIKRYSTVWYNAVIRGDINRVEYELSESITFTIEL